MAEKKPTGLALLRVPFPENQISKLPKATKKQNDDLKADFKKGVRCKLCGGWHLPDVIHLDYVGHAALTDRLLDTDENWSWEPVSTDPSGLPLFDKNGGLWIKLTVCGLTRLGYGHAEGKQGGDAVKEIIGDALRNAAMRFGAALDLWHKGDLHGGDDEPAGEPGQQSKPATTKAPETPPKAQNSRAGRNEAPASGELLNDLAALQQARGVSDTDLNTLLHLGFGWNGKDIPTFFVEAVIDHLKDQGTGPASVASWTTQLEINRTQSKKSNGPAAKDDDPANFIMPVGQKETKGKALKQLDEKTLKLILATAEKELKKDPSKTNVGQWFEIKRTVGAFLKSMGVS